MGKIEMRPRRETFKNKIFEKHQAFILGTVVLAVITVVVLMSMAGALTSSSAADVSADKSAPNAVWAKNFGGNDEDCFSSVIATDDGFIAVGYSETKSLGNGDWTGVAGKGGEDAIIVKYDLNGNVVWKKNFGGSDDDWFTGVVDAGDGYVAVGASTSGSFGNGDWAGVAEKGTPPFKIYGDAIIVKFDLNGKVVWKKTFGGSYDDTFFGICVASGGYVVVGGTDSRGSGDWSNVSKKYDADAMIVKFDLKGNVVWKKVFGGSNTDVFRAVVAASDGYVATGYSRGGFDSGDWVGVSGNGDVDAIAVKFDQNGNVMWKDNFGGLDLDYFYSVAASPDGYVAVGESSAIAGGDWTGSTQTGLAIIVKFDTNGNILWKKAFGGSGSGSECFYSVAATSDGYVAAGGSYVGAGGDWTGVAVRGGEDAVIVKFDTSGNAVWKKSFGGSDLDVFESIAIVSEGYVATGVSHTESFGNGDLVGLTGNGGLYDATIVLFEANFSNSSSDGGSDSSDSSIMLWIGIAVVIIVLGAAAAFILHRRKI